LKSKLNLQPKHTILSSIKINQTPLLKRKDDSPFLDFLIPTRKAETPARKQKIGAQ
jgi:hypothetical protein